MKKTLISFVMTLIVLTSMATVAYAASSTKSSTKPYVASTSVNVRSGPGTSYSEIGNLAKGTKETGTVTDGWLKFSYNGKTAYCLAKYFSSESTVSTAKSTTYQVNVSTLRVRSGPGASYSKLGELTKGTKETGVVTNGWLKFTFDNKTAYCKASCLSPVNS